MIIKISLNKHRSTWVYVSHNDVGGSFGSNHCGSKKVALHKAAIGVPVGGRFDLFTNGRFEGVFERGLNGEIAKTGGD